MKVVCTHACRNDELKMYEIGATVLSSIPAEVQQCNAPPLDSLPRIMASCDAVIKNSTTGKAIRLVEAKHRFPFAPPAGKQGMFTFLGRTRGPQKQISYEQFAQCQLQMMVMDIDRCDLISYSLGSSRIFHLQRDNAWLALALQILQHMHITYMLPGEQPKEDALMHDKPQLYHSFLSATIASMQKINRQPHTDVESALDRSEMSSVFLDNAAQNDDRRHAIGKRPEYCLLT